MLYLTGMGGVGFYVVMIPLLFFGLILPIAENAFLGYWADQYNYGHVNVKLHVSSILGEAHLLMIFPATLASMPDCWLWRCFLTPPIAW
jgi:hypothetical protein